MRKQLLLKKGNSFYENERMEGFNNTKKASMTTIAEGREGKKVTEVGYSGNPTSNPSTKPSKQIQAIVQGTCTFNNTHVIVRDFKGKVLLKASGGLLGKSLGTVSLGSGKKSSAFAALYLAEEVAKNILEKGISRVELVLKGFGKGRSYIHRGLRNAGLQVLSIKQATNLPHNGCRPRKSRRL
jgi:small subunit ribosomal protein S11